MEFYKKFAQYYDDIFLVVQQKVDFLAETFKDRKNLLDIGCATGAYANALADKGFCVEGIDLSEAMIEIAKDNYQSDQSKLHFSTKDMMDLKSKNHYDGIYMIGNTLVHLSDEATVQSCLKKIHDALTTRGRFVVQILNYHKILKQQITELPLIEGTNAMLKRTYEHHDSWLVFNTVLKTSSHTMHASTKLYPLEPSGLETLLKTVGFTIKSVTSGFHDTPFDPFTSFHLVIVAEK